MPKLWQYQARIDILRALPQPVAPNGWEAFYPDGKLSSRRRGVRAGRQTEEGFTIYPLRALPQPVFSNTSFTVYVPDFRPKKQTNAGNVADVLATTSAVVVQFPSGWSPVAPDRAQRRPVDAGSVYVPGNQPPAATAQNPLGWECNAPDRMQRRPVDAGSTFVPNDKPPASTATNPLGWESVAPEKARKIPVDAGTRDWALNQPPAATARNPLGWEPLFPWLARKTPTSAGLVDYTLFQPPAATARNPLGWEAIVPHQQFRRVSPFGSFSDYNQIQPARAVFGWEPITARQPQHQAAITAVSDLRYPVPVITANVVEVKIIAPETALRRQANAGAMEWVFGKNFLATFVTGWNLVEATVRAMVRKIPGTFIGELFSPPPPPPVFPPDPYRPHRADEDGDRRSRPDESQDLRARADEDGDRRSRVDEDSDKRSRSDESNDRRSRPDEAF